MHLKISPVEWPPCCLVRKYKCKETIGGGITRLLTHWGRVTYICVNLTIIVTDNGLSPGRRQAIIWTSAWILLIGPLGTNFSEILIEIVTFSFKKMRLKVSSAKWRPWCLGLNVLTDGNLSSAWPVSEIGFWLNLQIRWSGVCVGY